MCVIKMWDTSMVIGRVSVVSTLLSVFWEGKRDKRDLREGSGSQCAPTGSRQGLMLAPHAKELNMTFDNRNVIMCMIYDHYIGFILLAVDLFQVCVSSGLMSVKQL